MKRGKGKFLIVIAVLLIIGIYYYVSLPAINIHASGFWIFLIAILVLILALCFGKTVQIRSLDDVKNLKSEIKGSKLLKAIVGLIALVLIVYVAGSILSSP
ncbi:MAG: CvpA family protein, partial [Lachnospiraceae bacterium]|nr:CvpA family protein [Lachnospiraceae bacterium]